jgi:hypothetical protein
VNSKERQNTKYLSSMELKNYVLFYVAISWSCFYLVFIRTLLGPFHRMAIIALYHTASG